MPIAGDALEIVSVRLQGTGSPYDLKVGVASFTDKLVQGSLAGPRSMVNRVRDAMVLVERTNGKAPEAEPGTAPAQEGANPWASLGRGVRCRSNE